MVQRLLQSNGSKGEDLMATMVGNQKDLAKLLNSLIELDFDAIAAYRAAIDKLESAEDKGALRGFMADHERHTVDLRPFVERFGEKPAEGGDVKAILTKGKVVIAGLMGDKAILEAMKTNEDDTNRAYERATARTDLPDDLRAVLNKNLADERRHREYIVMRLGSLEAQRQPRV
jgi:uncharacterized protein (TIGR02284 family)